MQKPTHGNIKTYSIGFVLSIVLTIISFAFVTNKMMAGTSLILALLGFACLQLFVQLFFFLHLGQEEKPRWNLMLFLFTMLILLIIVLGSLWIMYNLDYNMMSPHETNQYIQDEEAIRKD